MALLVTAVAFLAAVKFSPTMIRCAKREHPGGKKKREERIAAWHAIFGVKFAKEEDASTEEAV